MSSVRAHFDGRVFVPDSAVDLPVGYTLEIPIPSSQDSQGPGSYSLAELAIQLEKLPANPEWPADGAAQHDHYLYGTAKKQ
ncbi:MAG: hypothetical protein O3C40_30860 [Planctomycetota bacterium]|nr:hypothetical protein [Planctomycetota bacterium]